ncbi:hypothetical protein ONZ45_g3710 [Pleurotus djamor]|nr:hypothetical protein ONZ45_g3710 [Pleurotus djamor]
MAASQAVICAFMWQNLPLDIVQIICATVFLLDSPYANLSALCLTSRSIRNQAQRLLYHDIQACQSDGVLGQKSTRIISISQFFTFSECINRRDELARLVLKLKVFSFDKDLQRIQRTLHALLKKTVNLEELLISVILATASDTIPMSIWGAAYLSLNYFSWNSSAPQPPADDKFLAKFLNTQSSLRRLRIHGFSSVDSVQKASLPHLHILESQLDVAVRLAAGRNITHLEIRPLPGFIHLTAAEEEALLSVRVLKVQGGLFAIMPLLSHLKRLVYLEASGGWSLNDFLQAIDTTISIRRLRLTLHHVDHGSLVGPSGFFQKMPNLEWMEHHLSGTIFERRCRNSDSIIRVQHPDTSSAWLQDWDAGLILG